jgi:hypothetical protein
MLVAVAVKCSRLKAHEGHSYKVQGGVLNTEAVHGRGYYTRRINGQSVPVVLGLLKDIAAGKKEHV